MQFAMALRICGALLPVLLFGEDSARCRLNKDMYQSRLAIQRQGQAAAPATGDPRAYRTATRSPNSSLATIDREYRQFLTELSDASARQDGSAIRACCDEASADRAGALFCQLVTYLNGGRIGSPAFLKAFPSTKRDISLLWDLDSIVADRGKTMFPPRGPSYSLVDELFLLVLDGQEAALSKYFDLSAHTIGEQTHYMDSQIRIFLEESPFVVIDQWPLLRRYKPKLNSVVHTIVRESTPAEVLKMKQAVKTFCEKGSPNCPEVLKLYGVK